jgi:malate dehydrogenase
MTNPSASDANPRDRLGDEPPPPVRIAISGAAGRVGYGLAFQIASGSLFGFRQPLTLSMLETPPAMKHLQAMRLELRDCALPLLDDVLISDDPHEAFADADWIVMLASRVAKPSAESRHDLVRANSPIYAEHAAAINNVALQARALVVAEPCNTNCRVAIKYAPNLPAERWMALNRLDRMRATALIAEKAGVPVARVNRVTVWGNRSGKIFPDFHNAFIGERPAHQVITDSRWAREVLEPTISGREQELFENYGATPSGTAVQAILGTIRSSTAPTPVRRRFGAAVRSDGEYGVPRGLVFGFPLRTVDGQTWSIVEGLYLDEYAQSRLEQNVEELEREAVIAGV